jgi:hypothetical protein
VHPPDGLPDGQISHTAGPTQGGFLIAALWDSKVSADRFVSETLMASMPLQGGFEGQSRGTHGGSLRPRDSMTQRASMTSDRETVAGAYGASFAAA